MEKKKDTARVSCDGGLRCKGQKGLLLVEAARGWTFVSC